MNNEPIRWLHKATKVIFEHRLLSANPNDLIPLYTHPAKTLTDEEIERAIQMLEISAEYIEQTDPYGLISYDDADCDGGCVAEDCRSIAELLRKAQEK